MPSEAAASSNEVLRDLLKQLKHIQSRVHKVRQLVQARESAADIVQATAEAIALFKRSKVTVVRHHVESCVCDRVSGADLGASIDELVEIFSRFAQ